MHKVARLLLVLLSIATGALFLYSAYTKVFPNIQSFEYTIVEFTHIPLMLAKIVARLFISLEAGLGALLVLHFFGKNKWTLKTAFGLLVFFSVFLIFLWIKAGNNINCGCFGDAVWMTPSQSLMKNGLLLIVVGLLIRYGKGFEYRWVNMTALGLVAAATITCYIVFPVYEIYRVNLKPLYTDAKWAPAIDLAKGKHLVAFVSPSCMHCRQAAIVMRKLNEQDPAIPFYMIIAGVESDLTDFWAATDALSIPHTRLNKDEFLRYTKGVFPQIFWLNNSWVEDNTGYPELDQKLIEKWIK
jgi:uncharacterized membrane protein YphA (DoxX/SURF4 family)